MKKLLLLFVITSYINLAAQTPGGGVTDIDGNNYSTVIIGNQEWMSENLTTSSYSNGDPIDNIQSNPLWQSAISGAWADYNNDGANGSLYGKLYNGYAIGDSRNVCPTGWHVPVKADWDQLVLFIDPAATISGSDIQSTIAGGELKSTSPLWSAPNTAATNNFGFNGQPGGMRNFDGNFYASNTNAVFWSSTDFSGNFVFVPLYYLDGSLITGTNTINSGYSLRCIKNCESDSSISINSCSYYMAPDNAIYTTTGIYTAVIPNSFGCDSTITIDLTINTVDTAASQIDAVTLQANATGAQYQWVDCDNNYETIVNETNQSFIASSNGSYAVIVTQNNCSDTSSCMNINSVDLDEIQYNEFSIFPNPAIDVLSILANENTIGSGFYILDQNGRVVYADVIKDLENKIDISFLSPGIYFVEITGNHHKVKFIK